MTDYRFDKERHLHLIDSRRVTGITEAISRGGLSPAIPKFGRAAENFKAAGQRGTAIHDACELVDSGMEDQYSFDPAITGYMDAWKQFCADFEYTPDIVEVPMAHPIFMFGGIPDTAGLCGRLRGYAVVERKSRPLADYDRFQVAGQLLLIEHNHPRPSGEQVFRIVVQLKADGSYTHKEYRNRLDRGLFLAAVAVSNYQISQGR